MTGVQTCALPIWRVWVHLPAEPILEKVGDEGLAVMVFQDGHAYVDEQGQFRVPIVLDNLVHAGKIPPLAAIFVVLIGLVGLFTGLYAVAYVRHDVAHGELTPFKHKLFFAFFNLFVFTMMLAVTANNIVMMWVAVEATTLGSAFLVGLYGRRSSLEAAWKYVIICTVGVAFGLYGTVLTFADGAAAFGDPEKAVFWTSLMADAGRLDPMLVKIAFVFVLIGFGTKAGLFPMHAWLPDAHSEAPSPVSALLSGVLLKCALFVVIRYFAITARAVGPEFPQSLMLALDRKSTRLNSSHSSVSRMPSSA